MSTSDCNVEKFRNTAVTKCRNKLNVTQSILSILNLLENGGNYEKLGTENEMIKQQPAKNMCNSHTTCPNSSRYPLVKNNNQKMLEKEVNKTINEAKDNKVTLLSFVNKRKDTHLKCNNNNDNPNNINEKVINLNMLTLPVQVPTKCSLDERRNENNNVDDAMAEHQQIWSNNSDNNNERIAKGKVKVIDRNKKNTKIGDCTKKDKGGIDLRVNKGIEMKKDKEV